MFKAISIYKFTGLPVDLASIEDAMDAKRFVPCGPTQEKSVGFVEPRNEVNGALVESVAGQLIMSVMIETKSVPGATVREKAQAEADHIEATTARKPGKKETKQLREDALLALLPAAFPRKSAAWVWVDREDDVLVVGSTSSSRTDEIITLLVSVFKDLRVAALTTNVAPSTAMTNWLSAASPDDYPYGFDLGRACELKSNDEQKSVVKFDRHNLDTDDVRKHITEGKLPTKLAMTWEGRVGFVLDAGMRLSKINFLEGVFDDRADSDETGFDADVALSTGELKKLIPALVYALGGEPEQEVTAREPGAEQDDEADALIKVAQSVVQAPEGRASISYVQRKLQIGYNRAARLVEELEAMGIVGAMKADGSRDVLVRAS